MLSACVSSLGFTTITCGSADPAGRLRVIPSEIRCPMPVVVASRMRELVNSAVARPRFANTAGMMMRAPKNSGPKIVAKMNHFVRTRSRYSRLTIAQSLAMTRHPRFDSGCADPFEEDLVE